MRLKTNERGNWLWSCLADALRFFGVSIVKDVFNFRRQTGLALRTQVEFYSMRACNWLLCFMGLNRNDIILVFSCINQEEITSVLIGLGQNWTMNCCAD